MTRLGAVGANTFSSGLPFGKRLRFTLASSTALSAGALMLAASSAAAVTVDVTNQSEFDAAIQQAINTGQPNTINVNAPSTIFANTGLVLPGLASPLNLNFNGTPTTGPILGVGSDSTTGSLTIGAGTNLTFTPSAADIARFRVGRDPGGNGTVTMTGGTVTANESGGQYLTLGVGLWGATGTFNQSSGAVNVAGGSFQVGSNGGHGAYNLSGDGAVLGSGGPIYATTVYIGDSTDSSGGVGALHGVGVLHISGNATFALTAETGGAVWVGNNGGEGTITQDGAGSHVVINGAEVVEFGTNSQYVGAAGTGTYNLINGSLDIADNGAGYGAKFGALAGGFGYFNQSGGVFTSENAPIIFGSSGAGQYNLSDGTATFGAGLIIAQNAGSMGVVNQTGGVLTLSGGQIQFGAGDGAYNLNGGVLQIGGANPITTGAGAYQFNLGGGTIKVIGSALTTNVNATLTSGSTSTIDTDGLGATFSGVLSGAGALTKTGAGTLLLSGVNTYTGATLVSAGTLQAGAVGAFASASAFTVASGATLDLNGFSQTIGSLAGAGAVKVGVKNLTVGGDNSSTAFSGTISMTNQGYGSNPYGTFLKTGSGTLTIDNATIQLGESYIAQGAIAQTSGTTAVTYLAVGEGVVGSTPNVGALIVSGGAITFGTQLQVGDFGGRGTVTQTGGTVKVTAQCGDLTRCAALNIGNQGGNGVYNISGGELDLTASLNTIGRNTGSHPGSTGALNISGGLIDLMSNSGGSGGLIIGYGNASASGAQSSGTITQTGGVLRIENNSALFLSGYNTSTGVYNLDGGTLQVGGAGLQASYGNGAADYQFNLGGGTIQVIGSALATSVNAKLTAGSTSAIDTNGLGATFSSVLSGAGALAKIGAGTLVLSGVNAYAGGTTITGGVLQATNNSSIGTGAITLDGGAFQAGANGLAFANNVTLDAAANTIDTQGYSLTLSGPISGAGGLDKQGSGVLILSGAGSYAGPTLVGAGTLQAGAANAFAPTSAFTVASGATLDLNGFSQTIGSLAGAGAVTLGAASLTAGGDGSSTTFSGGISGAGGLTKTGAGTLVLSGDSAYTGPTTVGAGVLDVNGSLASAVTVESGATLKGDGSLGGLAINNGGLVAPGNSIGTLSINGNVSFAAGSVYQVEVNAAGQSDKVAASGTATLSGGVVQVLAAPGVYAAQTKYTILTAADVAGTFSGVTSNFAFLTPTLSYDPGDVVLTLSRNATYFSAAAETPNQRAVATALDLSPFGSALVQAALPLTAPQAAQAFDALSGEIHASIETVLFDDSRYMRQAVLGRLRQASFTDATGPLVALSSSGPTLAYAEPPPAPPGAGAIASALAAPVARTPDTVWWGQGVGAWGWIAADGDAAALSRNLAGFFTGVDSRFGDNWRAGIATGYANSSLSSGARASSANIETVHFAAYALANYLSWTLRTGADFAWNMIGSNRSVLFPGFADYTAAHYDSGTAQQFGELGYGVAFGGVAVEPFAGLAFVRSSVNGFSETGGVAALAASGNAGNVGYSTLGGRIATSYALPNGMAMTPRVSIAWQYAFGDVNPGASLAFENTGPGFFVSGAPIARNAALVEAGLDLAIAPQATIGLSYAGQLAGSAQDQSVKGNLSWRF